MNRKSNQRAEDLRQKRELEGKQTGSLRQQRELEGKQTGSLRQQRELEGKQTDFHDQQEKFAVKQPESSKQQEKFAVKQPGSSKQQENNSGSGTEPAMLQVEHLSVAYGDYKVLDDLSFSALPGQWVMIAGPNGAGKSTTLEAISQTTGYTGRILLNGRDAASMKAQERARFVGVLAQNHYVGYDFTVEEVVRLGRYSHGKGLLGGRGDGDDEAVEKALAQTGMDEKRNQSVLTLSGGELQRVFLAQVMAQAPSLLLLDEPTNHLDLVYQKQIFGLISQWLKEPGRTVVSVVHDLSLAKAFGTHAVLIDGGHCIARGRVDEVLTPACLNDVYHMDVSAWMRQMLEQWL